MYYIPKGVCSSRIDFEINNDKVENVKFTGGCSGNTQGVAALVNGMSVTDAVRKLKGIRCGFKSSSCPDQLAVALEQALNSKQ